MIRPSTLGKAILNLEAPTAGSLVFDGVDIASLKGEALRRERKRFQMVFQDSLSGSPASILARPWSHSCSRGCALTGWTPTRTPPAPACGS